MSGYVKNGTPVGASLPTASGAGEVPVSTGAGTTYAAQAPAVTAAQISDATATGRALVTAADAATALAAVGGEAAGAAAAAQAAAEAASVPTSRTVAGAALSSDVSAATLRAALGVPAAAYLGPFSATAALGGDTGAVAPSLAKGRSLVIQWWKIGNIAGAAGIMAAHLDSGVTKGWDFGYDDVSGKLFIFLKGIASDAILQLTGWDALAVGAHGVAINFVDNGGATGHLRWALDGVVQSDITADGTYVPPTTAEPLWVGHHPSGGSAPSLLADVAAIREYSTALSDGDLVIASTPAVVIPTVTGTVAFDLCAARDFEPSWYDCYTGAASTRWRLTINGALKKRAR